MEIKFEVYPGSKGEKKHSRRYGIADFVAGRAVDKDIPLRDIYVMRPWSNDKDKLVITIEER